MKGRLGVKKLNILFSVLAVAALCAAWVIAYYAVGNEYLVPSFAETLAEAGKQLASAEFWVAFGHTFGRSLCAWLLAFVLAAAFASLSALSDGFARFFAPIAGVMRTVPTMAITLVLLVWTTPRVAPVIVSLLVLFPLTYAQLGAAYKGIDPRLTEMAEVYRIGRREKVFRIYLPIMLPDVFAQAGANLSLTLKVMISAEVLSSTFRSLGGLIHDAAYYSQMARMFAVVILVLITAGILEFALGKLTLVTDRWIKGRKNGRAGGKSA